MIPLNIKNMAAPQIKIPTSKTGTNKGLSWLLKAENKTEGPKNNKGSEIARNFKPLLSNSLFVYF